ncbi:MAG: cation:proton antiporter [Lachnospiraceae bacterium]
MSMLFYLGIMLLGGLLFGRLAKKVGLPNVTGYLVAGLIVGPYVLKIIPADAASSISMVSEMALGFIALSIGAEFKLSYFREVGVRPVVIAILEGLCAMGAVVCGLLFAGQTLAFSLVLGAIASATAPAATIMVIRQYNANGPLTKTLLSVVALDDAVALIAFGFAVTVAKTLNSASDVNIAMSIAEPFIELGISIVVGAAAAAVMMIPLHFFKKTSNRLCAVCGVVFLYRRAGFLRCVLASLVHDIRRAPCEHIRMRTTCSHCRYGDAGVHTVSSSCRARSLM